MKKKYYKGTWYLYWDNVDIKEFPASTNIYIIAPVNGVIPFADYKQMMDLFSNLFSSSQPPADLRDYLCGASLSIPAMRTILSFLPSVMVDMSRMEVPEGFQSSLNLTISSKTRCSTLEAVSYTHLTLPTN